MQEGKLLFFSGSSNQELGKKISSFLGTESGKITLKKFSNGETYARFDENVRGNDVFILQTATEPINDNLMELCIMIDAAKRASAGRITAVIPNYFYARQDRKAESREPITAKLIADFLQTAGADRIITLDLHCDQIQGFFNIPLDNLPSTGIFVEKALSLSDGKGVIVSPDAGSAKKSTKIATKMNVGLAIINKVRTGHNTCESKNIIGAEIKEKNCLIFDDIVDTAGSLCAAADLLKEEGAKNVYAFVTHGVLSSNAIEKINNSKITKLFVTDSIPLNKTSPKIEIVSVSKYLANAILCIHNNESVSGLFDKKFNF